MVNGRDKPFKIDEIPFMSLVDINREHIEAEAASLRKAVDGLTVENEIELLLRAITLLDLTTLSADDTRATVAKLCCKAVSPVPDYIEEKYVKEGQPKLTTASVCLYPNRVSDAHEIFDLIGSKLPIAAVAGGFPSGQYPVSTKSAEVAFCVSQGADEIDIVIDRSLVLTHRWDSLLDEVVQMRRAAEESKLKVILGTGECGSLMNVFKASMVSLYADAPFIKTSTGKEAVNATPEVGIVMCRAIKLYYHIYKKKRGLKPAGGIRTYKDILLWMLLVKTELGGSWLNPNLFRIGASSVLASIVNRIEELDEKVAK